jgi:glycosyltransferase involved in cell wall biosynthesis
MNVLLLTQVLPYPPDSGPKIKTWNVIKYLATRHEVTLVSFVRGDQSADIAHLKRYCRTVHTVPIERGITQDGLAMTRSLLTGQPWMMVRDDRRAMRELVDRLATEERFDVAHADQLNMCQYAARVRDAFKIFDAHNALWVLYKRLASTMSPGPRKWLLERDWRLLKQYEGIIIRDFDAVLAVTKEDKVALLEATDVQRRSEWHSDKREITVIPIAIDTDEISQIDRRSVGRNGIPTTEAHERRPQPSHILHIGTMYWPPNIDGITWFMGEIYPLIRQQRPDVVFDVIGSRPPQELVAMSGSETGVNVTGYVRDPTSYLECAALMVVPLRAGGGMRVKILNALAEGTPMVSTTLGAEGIQVTPEVDILLADTPADFATACVRLLNEPSLRPRLAENGRRLAEQVYDYRVACRPLDDVYDIAKSGG